MYDFRVRGRCALSCRRERYILAIKRRARVLWLLRSSACITILLLYPTQFLGLKIPSRLSHIGKNVSPLLQTYGSSSSWISTASGTNAWKKFPAMPRRHDAPEPRHIDPITQPSFRILRRNYRDDGFE